jgi:hypothetical protein
LPSLQRERLWYAQKSTDAFSQPAPLRRAAWPKNTPSCPFENIREACWKSFVPNILPRVRSLPGVSGDTRLAELTPVRERGERHIPQGRPHDLLVHILEVRRFPQWLRAMPQKRVEIRKSSLLVSARAKLEKGEIRQQEVVFTVFHGNQIYFIIATIGIGCDSLKLSPCWKGIELETDSSIPKAVTISQGLLMPDMMSFRFIAKTKKGAPTQPFIRGWAFDRAGLKPKFAQPTPAPDRSETEIR